MRLADSAVRLTHLQRLEAESIHIMREVVSEAEKPVMLYSVGKDSAVMLHLARKAFYPARRLFRCCMSIPPGNSRRCTSSATAWRARAAWSCSCIQNPEAEAQGINPFDHGSPAYGYVEDRRAEAGAGQVWLRRGFRRRAAGRGEKPCQGAHILLPLGQSSLGSEEPAAGTVAALQRAQGQGREHSRVSDLQLDRARYLAIYPSGEHPDRAALFRGEAPDGGARRHAADGR